MNGSNRGTPGFMGDRQVSVLPLDYHDTAVVITIKICDFHSVLAWFSAIPLATQPSLRLGFRIVVTQVRKLEMSNPLLISRGGLAGEGVDSVSSPTT